MGSLVLTDRRDYALFLQAQLAARRPVEAWCERHCPPDLLPPPMAAAIEADLADMGEQGAVDCATFAPGHDAEPLGVAWVLAGSSLGNRAMLAELRKRAPESWPVRFLSDEAMPAYFRQLRSHIEKSVPPLTRDAAISAAQAVFATFQSVAPDVCEGPAERSAA